MDDCVYDRKMECLICVEPFNKVRKCVRCPYCQHEACSKCVERFLVEGTIAPKCMKCQTEWGMEFLRGNMTKSFMNKTHKEHQRKALLLEAESNLGASQAHTILQLQAERLTEEIKKTNEAIKAAQEKHQKLRSALAQVRIRMGNGGEINAERREFFMACPHPDCRGMLSSAYKCGTCEQKFCSKCHKENTGDDHECHADDLETVRVLRENTKMCPKCHIGIYKTEGCDQMWCVQCHTCFSWRTGAILNGTIHNPHYYEYQRRMNGGNAPRNPGDVPCGGMPTYNEIWKRQRAKNTIDDKWMPELHRTINEIRDYAMPRAQNKFGHRQTILLEYGCQYLRKKITKDQWSEKLYRRAKQEEKYRRYYQVLEMLTTSATEELIRYTRGTPASDIRKSCEALFQYANEEIAKMRKQYNMSAPTLSVGVRMY